MKTTSRLMRWGDFLDLVRRYFFDSPKLMKRLGAGVNPDEYVDLDAGMSKLHVLQVGSTPPPVTVLPMRFTSLNPEVTLILPNVTVLA